MEANTKTTGEARMNPLTSWQTDGRPHEGFLPDAAPVEIEVDGFRRRFIDDYLALRSYELTAENRAIVAEGIDSYVDGEMVLPRDLVIFLDNLYSI